MALELYDMCKEFHVLPGAGGLLDQDGYHVYLLRAAMQGRHKQAEVESKRKGR